MCELWCLSECFPSWSVKRRDSFSNVMLHFYWVNPFAYVCFRIWTCLSWCISYQMNISSELLENVEEMLKKCFLVNDNEEMIVWNQNTLSQKRLTNEKFNTINYLRMIIYLLTVHDSLTTIKSHKTANASEKKHKTNIMNTVCLLREYSMDMCHTHRVKCLTLTTL